MEFGLGDGLAVLDLILTVCQTLQRMIMNMKDNKVRSERLSQRVRALQNVVLTIKQSGPSCISEPILNALLELRTSLACAEVMLIKYSKTKGIKSLVKSNGFEGKFQDMNQRLNEDYFTLSAALQAELREVPHKVYQTVSRGVMDPQPRSRPASGLIVAPSPPISARAVLSSTLSSQPFTAIIPVPPSGLLSSVQLPPAPERIVVPFSDPPPPFPTISFTARSPSMMVSPTHPISAQAVLSSTLSPPSIPLRRTYNSPAPYFP